MKRIAFLILLFLLLPSYSLAESFGDVEGAVYVRNSDGDTITFDLPGPHPLRISIRVNGIDTPEIKGKCEKETYNARQAQQMVADILKNAEQITLKNMEKGKYFGVAADVYVDGMNLAGKLIVVAIHFTLPTLAWAEPRYIDLTHPFDQSTIYWPTSRPFQLDEVHKGKTESGFWYEANNFSGAEHGGTHIDAPAHFAKGRWRVDEIPLSRLIAPGVMVDVSHKAEGHPDYLISEQDFLEWEKIHGKIPEGVIVLVRTGWERFWPDKRKYLGSDKPGDTAHLHFPGFGADAARFLSQKRKVAAVGLDTASLDFGQSTTFPAHQIFGEANVSGLENLQSLAELPAKGFRIIALPMKIGGGSGAPLRIVAEIE